MTPVTAPTPRRGALVVRPTARGLGVALVTAALVVIVVVTGSLGPVAIVAALGLVLVVAPAQAWTRARRSVGVVHAFAHAVPPVVPVGGPSTLEVTVVNPGAAALAPVGLERPDGRWRRWQPSTPSGAGATGIDLTSADLPGTDLPGTDLTGAGGTVAPDRSTARRWRRLLAPSTVDLVPVGPLGPGGSSSAGFAVPTGRRHVLVLGPRRVWVHDALGLAGVAVAETPGVPVVVHPRPASGIALPFGAGPGRSVAAEAGSASNPTDNEVGGELADLRPYVPGDRLHLLHWPAFARYGALLVRRFEPEAGAVVRIVVDDRAGVHRRAAFEQSLSAALAIVELAGERGVTIELATLSGWSATIAPTPLGVTPILPMLSTMQPTRTRAPGPVRARLDAESAASTIVTTATGESSLPAAYRRCPKVVVR